MMSLAASAPKLKRKTQKMPSLATCGLTSQERFNPGSPNFTALLGTVGRTAVPDMTIRQQNIFEYRRKVHKTRSACQHSVI